MGSKHGSLHIKTSDIDRTIKQLQHNHRDYRSKITNEFHSVGGLLDVFSGTMHHRTYVVSEGDIISLYNETFELGRIETAARIYSQGIEAPLFYSAVFDDDILCCGIASNGLAEQYGLLGEAAEDYGEKPMRLRHQDLCRIWKTEPTLDEDAIPEMDVWDLEEALSKELGIQLKRTSDDLQRNRNLKKESLDFDLYHCVPWETDFLVTPETQTEHERDMQEASVEFNRVIAFLQKFGEKVPTDEEFFGFDIRNMDES